MGRIHPSQEGSFDAVWRSERWNDVRKAFLNDERHPACTKCWKKEELGLESPRNQDNIDILLSRTFESGEIEGGPEQVYFRLGNECNLKCVMCTPQNSSKWYAEADIYRQFVDSNFGEEIKIHSHHVPWTKESLKNAKRVLFAGGEPFLIKSHYKVLDYLIEINRAHEVSLVYYTNGTIFPEELFERFKNFKHVEVSVSIEGTGARYNYIRYPGVWEELTPNLFKFDQVNLANFSWKIMEVYFLHTALSIEELFEWREQQQWRNRPDIILQELTEPAIFDVTRLSQNKRLFLISKIENLYKKSYLSAREKGYILEQKVRLEAALHRDEDDPSPRAKEYLAALDKKRGTSVFDSIPELAEILS